MKPLFVTVCELKTTMNTMLRPKLSGKTKTMPLYQYFILLLVMCLLDKGVPTWIESGT